MNEKNHLVSIKTIADFHLEEFMRCPQKYYRRQFLGQATTNVNWKQMVQHIVNQVIQDFYRLPLKSRSSEKVLQIIHKYSWGKLNMFESRFHYYQVMAKVTDHLLQSLLDENQSDSLLFLYEKLRTRIEELQIELSMTIQVAEWSSQTFTIKKYMVDDHPEVIASFTHMAILFCNNALQTLPERIEVISLLDGQRHNIFPKPLDVSFSLDYFRLMKSILEESKNYTKTNNAIECGVCPFVSECQYKWDSREKEEWRQPMYE